VDSTGNPRININNQDLNATSDKLQTPLGEDLTDYITAYRLYGGSSLPMGSTPSKTAQTDISSARTQMQQDKANAGSGSGGKKLTKIKSLWDLVNSQVKVTVGSGQNAKSVTWPSPLNDPTQQRDLLPKLLDGCTTDTNMDLTPRVNVNTAPQAVLTA